jgi:hypothetical protein
LNNQSSSCAILLSITLRLIRISKVGWSINHATGPSRVAVSALLQLALAACSAHWTTSSPLSQCCTPHHTTSPKPCSSSSYCGHQGHWPGFWRLLYPLAPAATTLFTKCRSKYYGGPYCNVVRPRFSLPPRVFTECFPHKANTQPLFCRTQAFVVGCAIFHLRFVLLPSPFISKATSFHAPLSFVAALVPQKPGACPQLCDAGLPRTSHIVATDERLSLVSNPSRRRLSLWPSIFTPLPTRLARQRQATPAKCPAKGLDPLGRIAYSACLSSSVVTW